MDPKTTAQQRQDRALLNGKIVSATGTSYANARQKKTVRRWAYGKDLVTRQMLKAQISANGWALYPGSLEVLNEAEVNARLASRRNRRITELRDQGQTYLKATHTRLQVRERCQLYWQGKGWKTLATYHDQALSIHRDLCHATGADRTALLCSLRNHYLAEMLKLITRLNAD